MSRPPKRLEESVHPRNRFGAQVRQLKDAAGWDLGDLSRATAYDSSTLSRVEHGLHRLTELLVLRLELALEGHGVLMGIYEEVLEVERREKLAKELARRGLPPGEPSRPAPEVRPVPGDVSDFVADVTVPDGSQMCRSEVFVKIWRIRNSGTVPWEGRLLLRLGPAATIGQVATAKRTPIPTTLPGEEVDLEVPCKAMSVEGSSVAYFKMADEHDRLYFPDRYAIGVRLQILFKR